MRIVEIRLDFIQMLRKLYEFMADTRGVTGLEYGFLAGGVGLAVMTGVVVFGQDFSDMMSLFSGYIDGAVPIQ